MRVTAAGAVAHALAPPSPWVRMRLPVPIAGAAAGTLLDFAAGAGRHARYAAALGYQVTAVDRDEAALQALRKQAPAVQIMVADLESLAWPLAGMKFDVVLCTNYLFRPRLEQLIDCVAPGGRLIYETFALGNARFGRPTNPDFLLLPGELLALAARRAMHVLAYEDGIVRGARPARVQRIVVLTPAPEGIDPESGALNDTIASALNLDPFNPDAHDSPFL
jgi:SAM-dependent methyltransferase